MNPNKLGHRRELVNMTEHSSEKGRRYDSFKQWEIFQDRIKDFVVNELKEQFDNQSVNEIPVISSVNLSKRIVNQEAVIYKEQPKRTFQNTSEEVSAKLQNIYRLMRVNKKMASANRGYKLQDQSHLWLVPKMGKLDLRVLKNHQLTVVPDPRDPETAKVYIINAMDKEDFLDQDNEGTATGYTAKVDQFEESKEFGQVQDEKKAQKEKTFIVWTKDFNFKMNQDGDLVSEIFENPLAEFGMMPFIDISLEKDFEYWVRQGTGVTDFTVEYNTRLSEAAQVVKMQGFAQAVLKGPKELLAERINIGPTYIIKLLNDLDRNIQSEFEFANPNSDINGTISWLESILSLFLSSRGIDPSSVTTKGESSTYNSGLERLLAMIDRISASREDFDVFMRAEEQLFELIKAWLFVSKGNDLLNKDFQISVPEEATLSIKYQKPEMIQSESDKIENSQKKIELGMSSTINEIMINEGVTREEAEEKFNQYQRDEGLINGGQTEEVR